MVGSVGVGKGLSMTEMLGTCGSVPSEGVRRFRAKVAIVSVIDDAIDLGKRRRKKRDEEKRTGPEETKGGILLSLCNGSIVC